MRGWTLQEMFDDIHKSMPKAKDYVRLVHVCSECGFRTPELSPLFIPKRGIPLSPPESFEIKNGSLCDRCNEDILMLI